MPHSSKGASLIAVMSAPYLVTNLARPWGTRTRFGAEGVRERLLEPEARVVPHRVVQRLRRQVPAPDAGHVHGRTRGQQVRLGTCGRRHARGVVHRDRGRQDLGGRGGQPHLVGDLARQPHRRQREISAVGQLHQAGVVQDGRGEQQFGVDRQPLELAQRAAEPVGPVAVLQQRRREGVLGHLLCRTGQGRLGHRQSGLRNGAVAPGMPPHGQAQPTHRIAQMGPSQRTHQRTTFGARHPL